MRVRVAGLLRVLPAAHLVVGIGKLLQGLSTSVSRRHRVLDERAASGTVQWEVMHHARLHQLRPHVSSLPNVQAALLLVVTHVGKRALFAHRVVRALDHTKYVCLHRAPAVKQGAFGICCMYISYLRL